MWIPLIGSMRGFLKGPGTVKVEDACALLRTVRTHCPYARENSKCSVLPLKLLQLMIRHRI